MLVYVSPMNGHVKAYRLYEGLFQPTTPDSESNVTYRRGWMDVIIS